MSSSRSQRVFVVSDVHVDNRSNWGWLEELPATDYLNDVLLLPGDVASALEVLQRAFEILTSRFAQVFYVPGNHDLWVRTDAPYDSIEKFRRVLDLCEQVGVQTGPGRVDDGEDGVWIVPLLSWYTKPEEGADSLFVDKEGEDPTLSMWSDNYYVRWPEFDKEPGEGQGVTTASEYFLRLNEPHVSRSYDAPVVSFSHFLPRQDLIFATDAERAKLGGLFGDPYPPFNFSRVAGTSRLDDQIRRLGSAIHVHGHQHRNRDRSVDGVRYMSHCLGSARERRRGVVGDGHHGPLLIWGG